MVAGQFVTIKIPQINYEKGYWSFSFTDGFSPDRL